jgi:hypothetical protein
MNAENMISDEARFCVAGERKVVAVPSAEDTNAKRFRYGIFLSKYMFFAPFNNIRTALNIPNNSVVAPEKKNRIDMITDIFFDFESLYFNSIK